MRVGLGQFNSTVGDLAGNAQKMYEVYKRAIADGVGLLVFPELAICGYPPEDLLYKDHFLKDCHKAIEKLAANCCEIPVIVGFPSANNGNTYNSAAILQAGKIKGVYRKALLPNFGVFDEERYFKPGTESMVVNIGGINTAITICLDIWEVNWLTNFLKGAGDIQLLVNISASPFYVGKIKKRQQVISRCAQTFNCAVCYCNLVGGQDEIVFDGRSIIAEPGGRITVQAKGFEEDLLIADIEIADKGSVAVTSICEVAAEPMSEIAEVYQALVLGTRDYARKNGFEKVLLGLSGGIDSSVTTAIATAALGPESVIGITIPTKFNSPQTIADAGKLAKNLGIEVLTIPIESVLGQFDGCLQEVAGWDNKGIAYENLQARIRGTILMSLSNQFGALVLTSSNKSETAVGYATLYGDTAGGFAVIKDVPKTLIYELARYINKINKKEIIPADVITRPPSAELRPDQKDTDSLPDYDVLDEILKGYVEQDKSPQQLITAGLPEDVVHKIIGMVDRNEYKRRQSPPGIKITPKAFGKDRRLPITNRYVSD